MAQNDTDTPDLAELAVQGTPPPKFQSIGLLPAPAQSADLSGPPSPTFSQPDPGTPQTAQPPGLNYNNTGAVQAVQGALGDEPTPQGGSANPGIYGLLPAKLQHGTLRNILGALGDAFLVGGGGQAQYGPRMERQQIGEAMAGYDPNDPQSVQAAIQRVAATGGPGSIEVADQLQKNANDLALRKATMENTAVYRQGMTNDRNQNVFNRQAPTVIGAIRGITDPQKYQAMYNLWDQRAKSVDPMSDASTAYGIPRPEEWSPGSVDSMYGMTSNQQQQTGDRALQRDVSVGNNRASNAARVQAAGISGGAHIAAAGVSNQRASEANFNNDYTAKRAAGQTTTPEEDARFAHNTQVSRSARRAPPASSTVHPASGGGGGFQEGRVYTDAHGNRAKYSNGHWVPQ